MSDHNGKEAFDKQIILLKIAAWICVAIGFGAAGWGLNSFDLDTPDDLSKLGSYLQGAVASVWSLAAFLFVYVAFLGQKQQMMLQDEEMLEQKRQFDLQLEIQREGLQAVQEASKTQNLIELIQYLQAPEVRQARHVVFNDLKNKPYRQGNGWTDDEKHQAATACAAYGTTGVLLQKGIVDLNAIVENWGPSILNVVSICKEFIDDLRSKRGNNYWAALLWLNDKVKESSVD